MEDDEDGWPILSQLCPSSLVTEPANLNLSYSTPSHLLSSSSQPMQERMYQQPTQQQQHMQQPVVQDISAQTAQERIQQHILQQQQQQMHQPVVQDISAQSAQQRIQQHILQQQTMRQQGIQQQPPSPLQQHQPYYPSVPSSSWVSNNNNNNNNVTSCPSPSSSFSSTSSSSSSASSSGGSWSSCTFYAPPSGSHSSHSSSGIVVQQTPIQSSMTEFVMQPNKKQSRKRVEKPLDANAQQHAILKTMEDERKAHVQLMTIKETQIQSLEQHVRHLTMQMTEQLAHSNSHSTAICDSLVAFTPFFKMLYEHLIKHHNSKNVAVLVRSYLQFNAFTRLRFLSLAPPDIANVETWQTKSQKWTLGHCLTNVYCIGFSETQPPSLVCLTDISNTDLVHDLVCFTHTE